MLTWYFKGRLTACSIQDYTNETPVLFKDYTDETLPDPARGARNAPDGASRRLSGAPDW